MRTYVAPLGIFVSLLLISSMLLYTASGYDQSNQRITGIQNFPSGITFYAIEWNQRDYSYAIAVGNDSSTTAVIYRYWSSNGSWNPIWVGGTDEILYDVMYDTYANNDTFIVVGDNGGESCAYIIYDAIHTPKIVYLGSPPPGVGFTAGCFDRYTGPEGTLVAVGTPYDTANPLIAWHDMTWNPDVWSSVYLPKGEVLTDVTVTYDYGPPIIVAVGYNSSTNSSVAYAFNYHSVYGLNVPPLAKRFYAIDWKPNGGYGIVVGEDTGGNGRAWKIQNIREMDYISYYNMTSGSESLKVAYWNGFVWKTGTVDSSQYAGYYTSIALDHRGLPHISYWDGGSTYLKHAYYSGGAWHIEIVDSSGNVGQYSSIAIGSNDDIHISYYDTTNNATKYAEKTGGAWNIQVVDSSGGGRTSIALDSNNQPHIAYEIDGVGVKYAWYNGAWNTETISSGAAGFRIYGPSIAIDSRDVPHVIYSNFQDLGFVHAYKESSGTWKKETLPDNTEHTSMSLALSWNDEARVGARKGSTGELEYYANVSGTWSQELIDPNGDYVSIKIGPDGNPRMSYYDAGNQDLMFAYYDGGSGTWNVERVDSFGDVGKYSSLAVGMCTSYLPMKLPDTSPVLRDVEWERGSHGAVIVGDKGTVYIHYADDMRLYNWTDPGIEYNFKGVGVKSVASPGYAIATSSSSGAVISYQVYDSGTQIGVKAVNPHINEMRLEDKNGFNMSDRQVDVGTYYYFFINGSYSLGWEKVAIDIYAWYDNNSESSQYNGTPGANLNFHLHYAPNSTDPYNNSGTWTLLWPNPTNPTITLGPCIQQVVDNPAGGTIGQNDGQDFYLLWANITLNEQVRYAPGDGTWDASTNQSDSSASFNDLNSWNFNVTITDTTNGVSITKYDEFGIYAYTEITAGNNPSGAGAPGTTLYLSPPSHVNIRSNREYFVTVNITDLRNSTGARIIPRTYVEVRNPTAAGDSQLSYAYTWRGFEGSYPIYVWGNNQTGTLLSPLDYGTYSAGNNYGYNTSTTYTEVEWRINIPPNTPEDEYIAVVSFEISY